MASVKEVEIWKCDNCGHVDHFEREVLCWQCSGKGEMIFQGKSWVPITSEPYYCDPRSTLRKLIEFPFRLIGLIQYNPLVKEANS